MPATHKFLEIDQPIDSIDLTSKNKFRWEWLTQKDCHGDFFSAYIRKLDKDGFAWCCYCKTNLKYSGGGVRCLRSHADKKRHKRERELFKTNHTLPAALQASCDKISGTASSISPAAETLPYGAASNVEGLGLERETSSVPDDKKPISLRDRISHQESLLCSFMAEHTIPLSKAPYLIQLAQELANDPDALKKLHMERQTATYKLKYGLSYLEHIRLVSDMKKMPFSLNIDESTSKGNKKRILNVLVSLYSDALNCSVCHLYASIEMTVVNATTVFEAVRNQFIKDDIPLTNLISVLSDSAAYMRGSLNGFHQKLKSIAPHVLDIDGDVCHHIHNAVGKFTTLLDGDNVIIRLLDDLFKDFDFSPDLREDLKDICSLMGKDQQVPIQRAGHRWMSIFDATTRFLDIDDALSVFYSAWLTIEEKKEHHTLIKSLTKKVKYEERYKINMILQRLKAKHLTHLGRDRKRRITEKLFQVRHKTFFLSNVIISILPMFKSFILTFEQKEPMVHRLHDEMVMVFKSFLTCYLTNEYVNKFDDINKINVRSDHTHPLKQIFIGCVAKKLAKEMTYDERKSLREIVLHSFVETAVYLKHKLPLNNKNLALLSRLDPELCGNSESVKGLEGLFEALPTVSLNTNQDEFSKAASRLQNDINFTSSIKEKKLDKWWSVVLNNPLYTILSPVVKACLSIFTGPRVESSFSIMNNIITTTTNRLDVATYEAIHKIKYKILNTKKSSIKYYHRKDPVYSPVDTSLCYHMQIASRTKSSVQSGKKKGKKRIPKKNNSSVHQIAQLTRDSIERNQSSNTTNITTHTSSPTKRKNVNQSQPQSSSSSSSINSSSSSKRPCTEDIRRFMQ